MFNDNKLIRKDILNDDESTILRGDGLYLKLTSTSP